MIPTGHYERGCPVCESTSFDVVLPLCPTPLGDALSEDRKSALERECFPLDVAQCTDCGHVFLPTVVEPEASYANYLFETARSPGLPDSMSRLCLELQRDAGLDSSKLVVDIGSNDGTWLRNFQASGSRVLGVEPSRRHAVQAQQTGVPTVNSFFTPDVAQVLRAESGPTQLVTANFVLANIPDVGTFFQSLNELSDAGTLISILTGYHPDQFRVNMFDFVYHEHVSYFSAHDFVRLGERYGFSVIAAKRHSLKGGSLQVLLRKTSGQVEHHPDVFRLLQYERWLGISHMSWFLALRSRVEQQKEGTHALLRSIGTKAAVGYGMSHSVTTLLYQFELQEALAALTDDNESRQGLFAPGSGLEVIAPESVAAGDFDAVVVLAWQHDMRIRERLRHLGWDGPVLQPLPEASVSRGCG